ncbi:MAG: hypothetical protein R2727_10370 [Bacteroidales bacterium]
MRSSINQFTVGMYETLDKWLIIRIQESCFKKICKGTVSINSKVSKPVPGRYNKEPMGM